nr:MAK10-like protein [Tanacetum cinerariifolium]
MNNLESNEESVDTPLVSPFLHSDNDSDDGEVLNELSEYENVGMLCQEIEINSFDGDDLAFKYMIGFKKFVSYFDPFLPMNIITRKAYNTIMAEGIESTKKNLVAVVRDVYVFVGSFTYITDFVFHNPFSSTTIGDENRIHALGDYSKPSHEGYRNTIELLIGNNVVPLRSDTIQLVQNGCSFYGLRSEDPNQRLKDFLKLVDSLNLDESLSEAWTRFKDLLHKVPHHGIDLWLKVQIFYDHVNPVTRRTIDQSTGGKLRDHNAEESWALLEYLTLYGNKTWNDPRDFAKRVKAIALPQDVPSTSECYLIELETQVQRLMEVHLALTKPTQVKRITTSCEICNGPHDTLYCMEDPEQAFVNYASSRTDEAGGTWYTFKPEQNNLGDTYNPSWRSHPNLRTLEKQFQRLMEAHVAPTQPTQVNRITTPCEICSGPHDTQYCMKDPEQAFVDICILAYRRSERLGDSKPFDTLADLGSCVNIIPLYLFKKLNIELLEETDHIFGLADGTKSYPVGIVKDVEVHIGKLKLLNDFYVTDMKKDPKTPLLLGRGFLATANAVIYCRMAKIAVREGITRSVFGVKGVNLDEEEASYWTTLGKRESYKHRPSTDGDKPTKNEDGTCHAKIRLIDPDGEEFTKTLQSIPTIRKLSERESPRKIIDLDHFYDT